MQPGYLLGPQMGLTGLPQNGGGPVAGPIGGLFGGPSPDYIEDRFKQMERLREERENRLKEIHDRTSNLYKLR